MKTSVRLLQCTRLSSITGSQQEYLSQCNVAFSSCDFCLCIFSQIGHLQKLAVLTFVPKRSRSRSGMSGMPPPLKHGSDNMMTPSLSSEHPYACFIVERFFFMLLTACVGGRSANSALAESMLMLLRVNGCIVHFPCCKDFGFAQG